MFEVRLEMALRSALSLPAKAVFCAGEIAGETFLTVTGLALGWTEVDDAGFFAARVAAVLTKACLAAADLAVPFLVAVFVVLVAFLVPFFTVADFVVADFTGADFTAAAFGVAAGVAAALIFFLVLCSCLRVDCRATRAAWVRTAATGLRSALLVTVGTFSMTPKRASNMLKVSLNNSCLAWERESRSGAPVLRLSVRACPRDSFCHLSAILRELTACFLTSVLLNFSIAGEWLARTNANSSLVHKARISSSDKGMEQTPDKPNKDKRDGLDLLQMHGAPAVVDLDRVSTPLVSFNGGVRRMRP